MRTDRIPSKYDEQPPHLEAFQMLVRSIDVVDELRALQRDILDKAALKREWAPHSRFIADYMRERGLSL
jgi:hypothetical protein